MSRKIAADHVRRSDLPLLPADQIVVIHSENTRLFKPDVTDLVESFLQDGQLQACIVRPLPDGKVQLVAGYRRWLAASEIAAQQEKEGIPPADRFKLACIVAKMSPEQAFERNVIENAERKSLSPVEAAHAIKRLRNTRGWVDTEGTQKIAKLFRKSVAWVSTTEDLLSLSEAEQFQVHRFYQTGGLEGFSPSVAQILKKVSEADRKKVLEDAREASMNGKVNHPKKKASTTVSLTEAIPDPEIVSKSTPRITARHVANAAEKAGAITVKPRQMKDLMEFIDGYEGSEVLRPLHSVTKELLTRLRGFVTREFNETALDHTLMKLDDLAHGYWETHLKIQKAKARKE
jgi:ParB/RepB/Spo0J family partition protein